MFDPDGFAIYDDGKLKADQTVVTPKKKAKAKEKAADEEDDAPTAPPVTISVSGKPLGMTLHGGLEDSPDSPGVYVTKVTAGGAAATAGIESGMRVLAINGTDTKHASKKTVSALVKEHTTNSPGKALELLLQMDPVGFRFLDGGKLLTRVRKMSAVALRAPGKAKAPSAMPDVLDAPGEAEEGASASNAVGTVHVSYGKADLSERLWESMGLDDIVETKAAQVIDLQEQIDLLCSAGRTTAVVITGGHEAFDGRYAVLTAPRHGDMPVYHCPNAIDGHKANRATGSELKKASSRFLWFNPITRAWLVTRAIGSGHTLTAAFGDYARPEALHRGWQVPDGKGGFVRDNSISCTLAKQPLTEFRLLMRNSTVINLSKRELSTFDVAELCAELHDPATRLRELSLVSNGLSSEALVAIITAVGTNTSLKLLQLQQNGAGGSSARALGAALKHNSTLRVLSLKSNVIDDDGAKSIAEGLAKNQTLELLSLADNGIDMTGMEAFVKCLRQNRTLQGIALFNNKLSGTRAEDMEAKASAFSNCAFDVTAPAGNLAAIDGATEDAEGSDGHPSKLPPAYSSGDTSGDAAPPRRRESEA